MQRDCMKSADLAGDFRARVDPWRTLAHDGSRRAEVRQICAEIDRAGALVDARYWSWREYLTLEAVAVAIGAMDA